MYGKIYSRCVRQSRVSSTHSLAKALPWRQVNAACLLWVKIQHGRHDVACVSSASELLANRTHRCSFFFVFTLHAVLVFIYRICETFATIAFLSNQELVCTTNSEILWISYRFSFIFITYENENRLEFWLEYHWFLDYYYFFVRGSHWIVVGVFTRHGNFFDSSYNLLTHKAHEILKCSCCIISVPDCYRTTNLTFLIFIILLSTSCTRTCEKVFTRRLPYLFCVCLLFFVPRFPIRSQP